MATELVPTEATRNDLFRMSEYALEATKVAECVIIETDDDCALAIDALKGLKMYAKEMDEARKRAVKPAQDFTSQVNAMFRPHLDTLSEAERTIKQKLLDYEKVKEARRREEEAKRMEQYAETLRSVPAGEEPPPPPAPLLPAINSRGAQATATKRILWRARVTDLKRLAEAVVSGAVAEDAIIPNQTYLNNLAANMRRTGVLIPGVEAYTEETMAIR